MLVLKCNAIPYTPVQKVLADLKVLQRGLAATKVSTTVYEAPLKMLPGPEDQKELIFTKWKEQSLPILIRP